MAASQRRNNPADRDGSETASSMPTFHQPSLALPSGLARREHGKARPLGSRGATALGRSLALANPVWRAREARTDPISTVRPEEQRRASREGSIRPPRA